MRDHDLDVLCTETARLVMGWSAADVPWAYDGVTSMWHTAGGEPVMTVFSWQPDRNDVHNMQVLDRMIELGFELTLTVCAASTVVELARGSAPVARGEDRDRRVALLRAALGAAKSLDVSSRVDL